MAADWLDQRVIATDGLEQVDHGSRLARASGSCQPYHGFMGHVSRLVRASGSW